MLEEYLNQDVFNPKYLFRGSLYENILLESSKEWSNDSWFKNQEERIFIKNNKLIQ